MTALVSLLLAHSTWCLPPSAPAWVAWVTWRAGDGAHCIGVQP